MAAYPEDRIRDRRTSLRLVAAALKAGVEPDDLLQAVKVYAKESEGDTVNINAAFDQAALMFTSKYSL